MTAQPDNSSAPLGSIPKLPIPAPASIPESPPPIFEFVSGLSGSLKTLSSSTLAKALLISFAVFLACFHAPFIPSVALPNPDEIPLIAFLVSPCITLGNFTPNTANN